jgi:hypothetical protein
MRWPASLVAGGSVFALIAVAALLGPTIAPYPYDGMDIMARFLPPSAAHWFGTDEFGRDVLSRMLYGRACRCSWALRDCGVPRDRRAAGPRRRLLPRPGRRGHHARRSTSSSRCRRS